MSLQKTEFQITGHLYKRSNDKSWANRLVSLSTDTGTIKIYAEKSGKKTMRGNCNIKKGKFTPLSFEDVGKPFAFELTSDDVNDDAVMVFAAADQEQYNEWKTNIEICFTIGETRRRKSVLVTAIPIDISHHELDTSTDQIVSSDFSTATELVTEPHIQDSGMLGIAEAETPPQPEQFNAPNVAEPSNAPVDNPVPKLGPLTVTIPTEHENDVPPEEKQKPRSSTPSGRTRLTTIATREDGASSPSSRRSTPSIDMLTDDQRQKLDKLTNRKSFKVPKSMTNLLNSNGLDKEREEILKQVKLDLQSPNDSPMTVPQPPPPKEEPKPPREIKLTRRPTEPQRSGHICRFDEKSTEHGEDAWITQFASLEIATGQFELFSELMGKKISRLKVNAADIEVVPYDCVFVGKLFAFQLRKAGSDPSSDPITILAADDMEGYGYWIVSFEDAKRKSDPVVETKETLKEAEEEKAIETPVEPQKKLTTKQKLELQMKAKMEGRPIPTFDDEEIAPPPVPAATIPPASASSAPLTAKQKLEMQMKAKLEGNPIPTFEDEDESAPAPAAAPKLSDPLKLSAKAMLEMQMKAKMEGRPMPSMSFDDEPSSAPTVEAPKKLTTKQKLEMQMKAKMEGKPIPSFDEEDEVPGPAVSATTVPFSAASVSAPPAPLTAKQKLEMQMKAKLEGKPIPTFEDEVESAPVPTASEPPKQRAKAMLEMQMKAKMEGRPMPSMSFDDEPSSGPPSLPPLPKHDHQAGQQNAKALLEMQMKAKFEGKPIPHLSFEDDVFNPALEEKSGLTVPVPVRGASQSFSSINSPVLASKSSLSSPKAAQLRSHEDPSQTLNSSNFGLRRSPTSAAGDLEISHLMSRTHSLGSISAVVTVNDENMDDVLRYGRGGSSEVTGAVHARSADPYFPEPRVQVDESVLDGLAIILRKVNYPSDRLSRRIKIWYCSSGFALSTVQAVEQFVQELKLTGDTVLQQFAEEKFDKINDWANLLEVLRKYEQKMLFDMPNRPTIVDSVCFEVDVKLKGKSFIYKIDEEFNIENLIRQIANQFKVSEFAVAKRLPGAIVSSDFNPWSHGMTLIKEDLAFAEDLVLYQEEVIEHMWQSHSALKSVIEQKDEVINQLYNQLSELQEKIRQFESDPNYGSKSIPSSSMFGGASVSTPKHSSKALQAIADREFNAADQDGDGRISREEWRKWIQDKHNLIQEHNQVKNALINEIKTLRAAMPAQQEQLVADLLKSEEVKKKLEEDMIQVHIERDNLKDELASMEKKCKEVEEEKIMANEVSEEKIKKLEEELEKLKQQLASQTVPTPVPSSQYNLPQSMQQPLQGFQQPQIVQQAVRPNQSASAQSNRSRANSHPYAYDMPEDRPIEIGHGEHAFPMAGRSNQVDAGDGPDHAMDLLTLASMDDSNMIASSFGDNPLNAPMHEPEAMHFPQNGGSQQVIHSLHPVQRLGSADGQGGVEGYAFPGYPHQPTNRPGFSQSTRGGQPSVQPGIMNALAVTGPRTMNIGSTPQRMANPNHRTESPRAPMTPQQAPQMPMALEPNQMVRQRLRQELLNKNQPNSIHSHAANPFNGVKSKMSTQPNFRKTSAMETSNLLNTMNRRSESPRENQAVNINGLMTTPGRSNNNRFASPSRLAATTSARKGNPMVSSEARAAVRR